MAADYTKFRTPFFKIKIGDSSGQNMVDLPHSILRLVEKVDILESFETTSRIVITLVEGSREPASPALLRGSNQLYKTTSSGTRTDIDLGANLTNKSGLLPDLRFSGTGSITFTTTQDLQTNAQLGSAQGVIVGTQEGTSIRQNKPIQKAPQYLFQERNQIQVTWGYIEDTQTIRHIRGHIILTETEFPEVGQPRTIITANDPMPFLDQLALTKSVNFGQVITTSRGNNVIDFQDSDTAQMLRDICNKAGIPFIISPNITVPVLDKGHFKIWIAGESFKEFLIRLGEAHNCYAKVILDPITGKETLVFITKTDFEEKAVVADPALFSWKQPGTLLKSFNIRADFGMLGGNTEVTIDRQGNILKKVSQDGDENMVMFSSSTDPNSGSTAKQRMMDLDPTGTNPSFLSSRLASVFGDVVTDDSNPSVSKSVVASRLENTPISSNAYLEERTKLKAADLARAITIDFTSIGYTWLIPGVIQINNIGQRYSGKFRILTVSHIIDANGYVCRATGNTYALNQGGTVVPSLPGQEVQDKQVAVQLIQPSTSAAPADPRNQLTNLLRKQ